MPGQGNREKAQEADSEYILGLEGDFVSGGLEARKGKGNTGRKWKS